MTVKELKEILNSIQNENLQVVDHYFDAIKGFYYKDDAPDTIVVLSRYNVQPRLSDKE